MPDNGLSSQAANVKLKESGPNVIARQVRESPWRMLLAQLASPMIWLLLGAATLSGILGEIADAIAIGAIVLLNALVGFFQEYRAERALMALRSMTAPRARVLRDEKPVTIAASDVVPEDLLLLEEGDIVAADARVVLAHALRANEAALTGESAPVDKGTTPAATNAPLAERHDHVFAGTSIVHGTGHAVVVGTGGNSELGKIAHLLSTAKASKTPLEKRLAKVSRTLLYLCGGVVVVVAALGLLRGEAWLEVLMSSVSLAVAAVPEGLPAIVTVALGLGVQRMAARHVLVRKLPSVETLGCATVICTDKTGTLTTGKMTVRDLWGPDQTRLLDAAAACCDASLGADASAGSGDPTELAILAAAKGHGIDRPRIEVERPRTSVNPFDSERKRMSITRGDGVTYVKGAFEVVVARAKTGTDGAQDANNAMAARGLRVLAVATGHANNEEQLDFLGLIGIADPPRPEAITAIAAAKAAGIRTVMITGDHPVTARAIAGELGLLVDGEDPATVVHARATAKDKLDIVRKWKKDGAIVAMTGDGVNDAPALKEADIGIAMGQGGTEVTREAADLVLTDDNYASIVAAVSEGRAIYDNIRRALVYLLGGNAGELLVFLVASIAGFPLPLLPLHLLWINLVTDGLPALALVTEPVEKDALSRPPRNPDEAILGRTQWITIAWTGTLQAACTLGVFVWAMSNRDLVEARSLAFSTLVFGEIFRTFAARSDTRVLWEVGLWTNLRVLGVVVVSAGVQVALPYLALTQKIFSLVPLSLQDATIAVGIGLIPVTALELSKLLIRVAKR